MAINKNFKIILTILFMLLASKNSYTMQAPMPKDPYESIRYNQAFNQEDIYQQFKPLMEKLECAKNVFPNKELSSAIPESPEEEPVVVLSEAPQVISEHFGPSSSSSAPQEAPVEIIGMEYQPLAEDPSPELGDFEELQLSDVTPEQVEEVVTAQELHNFKMACLTRLNSARRLALAQPALDALSKIGIMGGGAGITVAALGSGSFGGSIAATNAFFSTLGNLQGSYQSMRNLYSWPDNPLGDREDFFAQNKCFIPRVLWPKIINAFISARQSEFDRQKHTAFLDFALAFTTFKPKPKIRFKEIVKDGIKKEMSVEDVKNELNKKIDDFFKTNYTNVDNINPKDLENIEDLKNHIKINVLDFVDLLIDNKDASVPRYIYLQGKGGIGKTYFVQQLSNWIDELIPNSVQFEDIAISSAMELEGSAENPGHPGHPGAFLTVLHNQLQANKRGSVIMFDEGTWLNDMTSPSKRVFNGSSSKLSAAYFGTNIDGTGVKLDLPPMLIFVASNDRIKDDALASRFDIVDFPSPTLPTLKKMALETAMNSKNLQKMKCVINKDRVREIVAEWIDKIVAVNPDNLNFRYINGKIKPFLLGNKNASCSSSSSSETKENE